MQAKLKATGGDLKEVHTSGHIYADDIKTLVKAINAKTVIPIHTFEPEKFSAITSNVSLLKDGETYHVQ